MPDKRAGFTLLELIISLIIIGIIVIVIQNGFHICIRAWEKGESAIDSQQRYRFVLELIRRQLCSGVSVSADEEAGEGSGGVFKGDDATLEFASRISLVPGTPPGKVRVWYRVETAEDGGKALSFREDRFFSFPALSDEDQPMEEEWHVLLSGIKECSFEYLPTLPPDDQTTESFWQSSWEPGQEKGLPLAVRVRFQADEKSAPLYLVVPVGKRS